MYVSFIKPMIHRVVLTGVGFVSTCKYKESCSAYTIRMIHTHGTISGIFLGGKRFLTCIQL